MEKGKREESRTYIYLLLPPFGHYLCIPISISIYPLLSDAVACASPLPSFLPSSLISFHEFFNGSLAPALVS